MSTKLLGQSLQFLPLSYIVVDHIGLDHDTGDIAREKVVVSHIFYTCVNCAETSTNAASSRAWPMLYNDTLRRSRFLLLLLRCLHLIELTLRNDYRFIRYCFYLWCKLLDAFFALLQRFIQFLVDEDVVFVRVFQICIFFLECFEIGSGTLQLLFQPLYTVLKLFDIFTLIKSANVLHCCGISSWPIIASPHGLVTGSYRTTRQALASSALPKVLVGWVAATRRSSYIWPDLFKDLVREVGRHFVLENGDLLDHHLRVFHLSLL